MKLLVTGSAGHLGEGLVRDFRGRGDAVVGLDRIPSPFTDVVGSIVDRECVARAMAGVDVVLHAATLHKPHVVTHTRQQFVDTNVTGTLHLLEEAVARRVRAFVFTSTTSVFGRALTPPPGAPAAWVDEDVRPIPKNIYGVTKAAAEDLCQLAHLDHGLPCVVLRTSRFFPEQDDDRSKREAYEDANLKANEFLHRRVDLQDVVQAHRCALERAPQLGFGRYVISATTPFSPRDRAALAQDAPAVVERLVPAYVHEYARRGWRMAPRIGRVYVNERARADLQWAPRYDFAAVVASLTRGEDPRSPLARAVGAKPYHDRTFEDGPYPVR